LPTVTDANLVLGRIAPDYFLGGEMRLDPELAADSIRRHVAEPLSLDLDRAASGILRVVNANMAKGIRSRSIERGYDPREFTLVAFGGAGPLHAAELADDLGMRKVLVPLYPGALSAFGLATSDIRHDHVATLAKKEKELTPEVLAAAFAPLEDQARRDLAASRVPPEAVELARSVDMRYIGQSYELNVPLPGPGDIAREDLQRLIQSFHALHRRIYEYGSLNEETEVVNVRIVGLGRVPPVSLPRIPRGGSEPSGAWKGERLVHFDGPGHIECPIYERGRLRATNRVVGPAVIEERISCTVVPPGWTATTDDFGNLILAASAELRHPEPANSRPGGMR
ncbi:MAG: hydantoinase/oxoprolinase family protein, partial [Planctomycetes bacterium]|nr:hydantoinase/oxoprolinase family protein [Planctomycetota bacterium]